MPKIITQIAIKGKPEESGEPQRPLDLAPLHSRIGRRRKKTDVRVRIFDFGRYANGSERYFVPSQEITPLSIYVHPFWGMLETLPHAPTAYTGWASTYNAHLLSGDQDEWAETFEEIDPAENYQIHVANLQLGDYQEGRGYKYSVDSFIDEFYGNPNYLSISDGGWSALCYTFNTYDARRYPEATNVYNTIKVTRDPDYESEDVRFDLDHDCDVYLVPSLKLWEGRATTKEVGGFGLTQDIYIMNHFVKHIPRDFLRSEIFDEWAAADGRAPGQLPGGNWPVHYYVSAAVKRAWYELFVSQPESRTIVFHYRDWVDAVVMPTPDPDLNVFVEPSDSGVFVQALEKNASDYNGRAPYVRWFTWYRPVGQLFGAVHKKGGDGSGWYYIWNMRDFTVPPDPNPFFIRPLPRIAEAWSPDFDWFGGGDQGVVLVRDGST